MQYRRLNQCWICVLLLLVAASGSSIAGPLTAAFTYQGFLAEDGFPADGEFDLRFLLCDAAEGGNQLEPALTKPAVQVKAGVFTVALNFGAGPFDGTAYWLEMAVKHADSATEFTTLRPRQPITAVPNALHAMSANRSLSANSATTVLATGIVGAIPDNRLSTNVAILTEGKLQAKSLPSNVALLDHNAAFSGTLSAAAINSGSLGVFEGPVFAYRLLLPHAGAGHAGLFIGRQEDAGTNSFELTIALPGGATQGPLGAVKGGQIILEIDEKGDLYGRSFFSLADESQRQRVEPISETLHKLQELQAVSFETPDDGRQFGIGVQSAQEIVPEIVRTNRQGYFSVSIGGLAALLVQAVKEQQNQIAARSSLLEEQSDRIRALELHGAELSARLLRLEELAAQILENQAGSGQGP
jgi:hypothetical protein